MERPETGGPFDHVISIPEPGQKWISSVQDKINEKPKLLSKSAGKSSCCIFRVPQSLVEMNEKAYQPLIVSIGPYHRGKDHLRMIQEHKWRFLDAALARTQEHNIGLNDLFKVIASMEGEIRESYSETIECSSKDLIEMMVLDGCFIIEIFCIVGRLVETYIDDPIFNIQWIFVFIIRDFLRLENQIPFIVLETLFEKLILASRTENVPTLTQLALQFFGYGFQRPLDVLERHKNLSGKHLLDLFRSSFIPTLKKAPGEGSKEAPGKDSKEPPKKDRPFLKLIQSAKKLHLAGVKFKPREAESFSEIELSNGVLEPPKKDSKEPPKKDRPFLKLIQSAKKLHLAGVKFKPREAESFLEIEFSNGVLEIPHFTFDDLTSSVMLNCVAFELCYKHCSKHITSYVTFMSCLINTPSDAGFLSDHKIIENYSGTDEEVHRFFSNVGKDVAFDIHRCYLARVFEDVNEYHGNNWHVRWAGFKHTYFDTPWSFMSALAASILLILTFIQAFFAVYQTVKPSPK